MNTELRWIASIPASALHAAAALLAGARLTDDRLAAAIEPTVDGLREDMTALGLEADAVLEHLIPLVVQCETPQSLAKTTLAKLFSPDETSESVARLARRITQLESAYLEALPRALEELELRSGPLGEQWEARGNGFLAAVARLTDPALIVSQAEAILVQPVLGGGGRAHRLYNSIRIEAMLVNPVAELPEVTRLGWLVAQLNLDVPRFQGELAAGRLSQVGPLAMIPPALVAAAEVELVRWDRQTLVTALQTWGVTADADTLWAWWDTYQNSRPAWNVALAALDRMLDAPAASEPTGE